MELTITVVIVEVMTEVECCLPGDTEGTKAARVRKWECSVELVSTDGQATLSGKTEAAVGKNYK